jgi:arginyl-tRNA synthetase
MNIYTHIEELVTQAVAELVRRGDLANVPAELKANLDPTKDSAHGDFASNVAMVLAKPTGQKPRDIAEKVKAELAKHADVAKVEVAGPGFINITAAPAVWPRVVAAILAPGTEYGRVPKRPGAPKTNVEYVSANPTGPLHVGHCRGAVVGDALASLLEFAGEDVTKEYYINDAGGQVNVLGRSAFLRYREALGETITIPEGLYPGDYLKAVGEALSNEHGKKLLSLDEKDWLPIAREKAVAMMMDLVRSDLAELGIVQEVFFSERSMTAGKTDQVAATIADLRARDLIYEGSLPPPKGEKPDDWEDREQTLFRATSFGDDMDRALIKSDGSYTYFAGDMAYHANKVKRGFTTLIDVWGADHAGHVKRMVSAVTALSEGRAALDIKICQMVKLFKGGQPYAMSKRAGTFITVRDVVEEVGRDPIRFMMLFRKNDAPLDFDFDKVTEKSRDNAVFYVQYAHARTQSIHRKATEKMPALPRERDALRGANFALLTDDGEIALIKRLAQFPRMIEQAARAHEPHRVAFYLYDLASDLHSHYNRGKDLPHLQFIREDDGGLTSARLALVQATADVLHKGLSVLGVSAPDEMR